MTGNDVGNDAGTSDLDFGDPCHIRDSSNKSWESGMNCGVVNTY